MVAPYSGEGPYWIVDSCLSEYVRERKQFLCALAGRLDGLFVKLLQQYRICIALGKICSG